MYGSLPVWKADRNPSTAVTQGHSSVLSICPIRQLLGRPDWGNDKQSSIPSAFPEAYTSALSKLHVKREPNYVHALP